jgi:hypothetical protein
MGIAANTSSYSPLATRNALNKAFADKGIKGPVVALVSRSRTENLVITTTPGFTADFLVQNEAMWKHLIPYKTAKKDEPWFKVALHGIPTSDFNTPVGMKLLVEEIATFNKGYTPIGTPYWLTSASKRKEQLAASAVVAFATEQEAARAIKNRLYIAGISIRVEKLYTTAPTTQCTKCQGFGHLESYCYRNPKCGLCAENHATKQHYCASCKQKGTKCIHLAPKCANCKQPHVAKHAACEVLMAISNKTTSTRAL